MDTVKVRNIVCWAEGVEPEHVGAYQHETHEHAACVFARRHGLARPCHVFAVEADSVLVFEVEPAQVKPA